MSPALKFQHVIFQGTMCSWKTGRAGSGLPWENFHPAPEPPGAAEPHPRPTPRRAGQELKLAGQNSHFYTPLKMSSTEDIPRFENSMNFTVSKNIVPASQPNRTPLPRMSQTHFASMAPLLEEPSGFSSGLICGEDIFPYHCSSKVHF